MKEHVCSLNGTHMVQTTSRKMLKAVKLSHQNYTKQKEREETKRRQLQLITKRNMQDQYDKKAMLVREAQQKLDEKEKQLEIKKKAEL